MSHIRFFTSLKTQLTTVELDFDQIRTMASVSSGFRCSLLFLVSFLASQALAKPGNNANSTPVSSTATKNCNNVYNNFYAGSNKNIETFLHEVKTQLTHVEDGINILKGNKTLEKAPDKTIAAILQQMNKQLNQVQYDISILKANTTVLNEQNKNIESLLLQMNEQLSEVKDFLNKNKTKCEKMSKQLDEVTDVLNKNKTKSKIRKDCAELYNSGQRISGVYTVDPDGSGAFDVFCDQTAAGGGWTVFQKRLNGSVDFFRGWADYKSGFGNLNGEFWLGLDKIHRLTNTKNRLRVDLEDTTGKTAYAEYDMFAVTNERAKYKLSLGSYSGTAGDSLSYHRGYLFTTKDQDNDGWRSSTCAVKYKGAWWYNHCHHSNLNGFYHHGKHSSYADGVNWRHWKGYYYSAKRAEMKIRPVKF